MLHGQENFIPIYDECQDALISEIPFFLSDFLHPLHFYHFNSILTSDREKLNQY